MQRNSAYIIGFAAAVCFVCALLVSSSAVMLEDRQAENQRLDLQKKVLLVADLMKEGQSLSREEIDSRYQENVVARLVDLRTGHYVEGDPTAFDQRKAAQDPETSQAAPANKAKVRRIPDEAQVFLVGSQEAPDAVILPIEGMGLWSTLYGYIALGPDVRTIRNIIFYEHGETPGLGGEVDNPRWKSKWRGRLAFDENGEPAIRVVKGSAGPPEDDPYRVDGLSGATITSNGVTHLVQFWLGDEAFGPYLESLRAGTASVSPPAPTLAARHQEVAK